MSVTPNSVGQEILACFDYATFINTGRRVANCGFRWNTNISNIVDGDELSQVRELFFADGAKTRLVSATTRGTGNNGQPTYSIMIGLTPQVKLRSTGIATSDATQVVQAEQLARSLGLNLLRQPPMGSIAKDGLPFWLVLPEVTLEMAVWYKRP